MKRAEKAERIVAILEELYPDTAPPLEHVDPFTLLVAVMLSAQSTDKKVNEVTPALFAEASTPADMAALPVTTIRRHIRALGLEKVIARHRTLVLQAAQILDPLDLDRAFA